MRQIEAFSLSYRVGDKAIFISIFSLFLEKKIWPRLFFPIMAGKDLYDLFSSPQKWHKKGLLNG